MDKKLLLVDANDKFLGYDSNLNCHRGRGRKHRGFVTLLLDSKNRVLLQRRKHRLFNNCWDLTAISHPLHQKNGDENWQEASDRALFKEMGIKHVSVKKIGSFNFFVRDGENCENEHCAILIGEYDDGFIPNEKEVYEAKKVNLEEFLADIKSDPGKYTPWAKLATRKLCDSLGQEKIFKEQLASFIKFFEPYETVFFEDKIKSAEKYSPKISNLYKNLQDFSKGGKKMRGFFVYLGYMVGGKKDIKKILPICLAFELLHNFLLIHDDIIDKSDKRRGKDTLHKVFEKGYDVHYGQSMGILAGDIAFFDALELINSSDFSDRLKIECQRKLLNVILETGYGEILDVENSGRQVKESDIWKVTDLKTARYSFVGSLSIGAILAGVKRTQIEALEKFGLATGTAFQLADDILGVFGDEKITGKSSLSDLGEGKNTILVLKTSEMASPSDKKILSEIWGDSNAGRSDLEKVRQIIKQSGAFDWVLAEETKLITRAKSYIKTITFDPELRNVFAGISEFVINRKK